LRLDRRSDAFVQVNERGQKPALGICEEDICVILALRRKAGSREQQRPQRAGEQTREKAAPKHQLAAV
jgi:hypothetical protein